MHDESGNIAGFTGPNEFSSSEDDTNELPCAGRKIPGDGARVSSSFEYYSESCPGMIRKNNQDSTFTGVFKYCTSNNNFSVCIGMVADGIGGLARGEVASSIAVASVNLRITHALCEHVKKNGGTQFQGSAVSNILSESIKTANRIIYDKGINLNEKIGTTFTGVIVLGGTAYFGHVGDSRAYIIDREKKSIERVTRDHSLVGRLVELGHITDQEARVHPRRNEIYKMLGFENEVEVDTYYRNINSSSIILLVSDGLWELIEDAVILNVILDGCSISAGAKKLVEMANRNGGYDNISIVVIKPIE
jgi:protein phosphatase